VLSPACPPVALALSLIATEKTLAVSQEFHFIVVMKDRITLFHSVSNYLFLSNTIAHLFS
jgi:hypothetical protein